MKMPGLIKWVQNHVISEDRQGAPDGIGELWFNDTEALETAMNSGQMASAIEDAKNFFDMDKTYALAVDEKIIIG